MAPIKVKQSPSTTAQTLTGTTSSQDARLLVRETLRISANLASSSSNAVASVHPVSHAESVSLVDGRRLGLVEEEFVDSSLRLICCEEMDGLRWKYVAENDGFGRLKKNSIRSVSLHRRQVPIEELMSFIRSYVVPEGFPDSVTPSYVPYMTWRALKHFFGGAMGVFTTKTLLSSVGVSKSKAIPGAVAINWILKDGAGRVGKMLFARQGKKFDYDLKQLRFAGDLLMELGAGVELATAAVPHLFLPLACAANVAKLGTGLSIMISKRNPSLFSTFALLSCGYVMSSYQEVKSVVLHTLNRARFSVAVDSFLKTGRVPTLQEGNKKEDIFNYPWLKNKPIVLGPRFRDAFQDPSAFLAIKPLFEKERYIVTYNPSKEKVYALFKDHAKSDDILKAAFHAHLLLHYIHLSSNGGSLTSKQDEHGHSNNVLSMGDLETHIAESCKMVSTLYGSFKIKATEQGWRMSEALLNPGRARLVLIA